MSASTEAGGAGLLRQHLIDPEICIRCNTCEEACKKGAITHDRRSYAVLPEACDACGDCLPPCPTGAIDSWRRVLQAYPVAEQLLWDTLPPESAPPLAADLPDEVARLTEAASAGQGGAARPPWSAAHPYVGLYTARRPALATVAGNLRLTDEAGCDIRHLVLDFGKTAFPVLEGQSLGVLPPGVDESGRPHQMRLYSVASPRNGERPGHNNLALTVKRVTEDLSGRPVRGVASNYLCDLRKGDTVSVTGPYGATFLMPNHPGASLLLVCTGTGSAPMRAMTERRRRRVAHNEGGRLVLFFGARTRGELPYFGPLMRLPKDFIDVNLALSREPGQPRRYVQDLIEERWQDVAALLQDENCYIYLCGHKRMEEGVARAFSLICERLGQRWEDLVPRLREAGRYHVETY